MYGLCMAAKQPPDGDHRVGLVPSVLQKQRSSGHVSAKAFSAWGNAQAQHGGM